MTAVAKIDAVSREAIHRPWAPAALACMGVVFGDIGTSPLYTFSVAAQAASPSGHVSPEAVLGTVSLIFWSLIIVISIKYAILIMRADNHGEGGILALLALVSPRRARQNRRRAVMVVVGLIGATLLYGDGAITPAISVLSAIEGVKIYAPQMGRVVVPLTVAILVVLFLIQRRGTSFIGGLFGPVMLIWFIVAGALGIVGIVRNPAILAGLSPLPAVTYLWHAGPLALAVVGGAFLAVTGGEAFYADMGHFGPLPIRIAWFGVALPALTLNYFGQGGLLLAEPGAIDSSFYALAPEWSHVPLVVLATVATVIASQSIISGAYSMTQQAINLGFLPRMNIVHTAGSEIGQIYVPFVNWTLAAGTLAAVLGFGSSAALAGAYGIAVSLLMVITTLMATFVALHWKHNRWIVYAVNGSLLALDLFFFASTSTKLDRRRLVPAAHRLRHRVPHADLAQGRRNHGHGSPGDSRTCVRLRRAPEARSAAADSGHGSRTRPHDQGRAARALAQRQMQLHPARKRVAGRSGDGGDAEGVGRGPSSWSRRSPKASPASGCALVSWSNRTFPRGSQIAVARGQIAKFDPAKAIYFTGHETIIPSGRRPGMPRWREALFAFMHHNAQRPGAYFKIPNAQIMEIGIEFEI